MLAGARLVDLSQPLGPETIPWPGSRPFEAEVCGRHEVEGAYWRDLALPEHSGTHMDAPLHFAAGQQAVDELALEQVVRPAVVLDVRSLCAGDAAFALSRPQVESLEEADGTIPPGAAVLVATGWDAFVGDRERYSDFPGIGVDAAALFVERGVAGVGIDTMSVDPRHASDFPAHRTLQPAGIWHLEGLVGLDRLPARGAWVVAAPLPLVRGSGSPVRVFAILPP